MMRAMSGADETTERAFCLVGMVKDLLLDRTQALYAAPIGEREAAWLWENMSMEFFAIETRIARDATTRQLRNGFCAVRWN
jgi:hypothetical protein